MRVSVTILLVILACTFACAQEEEHGWSTSISAYSYFIPDDTNYVSPSILMDKNHLHLEARYNYEDQHTGSVWAGYNFSAGENWVLEFTPMVGGVFGNTDGIAPGWKITLSHKMLSIYGENEYVFDLHDSSSNFYYNWSEVTLAPKDWVRFGIVIQRTKAYQTDLDVQRGLMAAFTIHSIDLGAYVFNLGWEDPTVVFSIAAHF